MNGKNEIEVAVMGFGAMGELHVKTWQTFPEVKGITVVEPQQARREIAEHVYGCRTLSNASRLFELFRFKPDIVIVATRPNRHYEDTVFALNEWNAHVLCEKPLTLTPQEADELVDLADRKGRLLAVHHQYGEFDAFRTAFHMISNGAIGKFQMIVSHGKGRLAPYDLLEVGVHVLYVMNIVAGRYWRYAPTDAVGWSVAVSVSGHVQERGRDINPADAYSLEERYLRARGFGIGAGDYLHGYFRFDSGIIGVLCLRTVENPADQFMYTEFQGTAGRLRFFYTQGGRLFYSPKPYDDFSGGEWRDVGASWCPDPHWEVSMKRFAFNFLYDVQQSRGRPRVVCGREGANAVHMAMGIYASHVAGKPLALPLKDSRHPLLVGS